MPEEPHKSRYYFPALAGVLYFSEGLPYGIINELAPVYLRINHVRLEEIALLSSVGLPWTLKVFWAPLVEFGTYRRWIAGALLVLTILMASLAVLSPVSPIFWIVLIALAVASATQDIAVDAFTIRATPSDMLGPVNSLRVMAYRAAIMVGGGGLAALAGYAGWSAAFYTAAALTAGLLAFTFFVVPDDRAEKSQRPGFFDDLSQWLTRPRAGAIVAMVLLYRLGEFAIVPMIKPYWVDRGYSVTEIGTITTVVGVTVSVAGAVLGGLFISRFGLYSGMLWLGLSQVVSNIGYGVVSSAGAGRWAIYAAAVLENLGFGLGTAAFLAFLMSVCDKKRAATEYALLTALFGVTRSLMGSASGWLAHHMGYAPYFWLTVALGVPALFLLPTIREDVELRIENN
jgi:PAT family beta-lactamase induction signal transducer AmpG